jgi:hypothetical protein
MKLIEGSTDFLPLTVHVEQDGNYFFILPRARTENDWGDNYLPALAVLDTETHVGFDLASGKGEQNLIRAYLALRGVEATFDY